ncbi:unnamed protein product [Ceratitis capitata]|uniref:(Mediterranean fruit fly) hypothetical protein n=1 Tax=Ceratitis capitata TaxID=7213 RepID=A0A811UQH6_CERCA|nr:unnamed protein product [Ceratitis capitata]
MTAYGGVYQSLLQPVAVLSMVWWCRRAPARDLPVDLLCYRIAEDVAQKANASLPGYCCLKLNALWLQIITSSLNFLPLKSQHTFVALSINLENIKDFFTTKAN